MRIAPLLVILALSVAAPASDTMAWRTLDAAALASLDDDDLDRHRGDNALLDGIAVSEVRISENGFAWQILRFASIAKPEGPLWVVPHDDENAAFEAMIAAIRTHGGVGLAVNTQPAGRRRQPGSGYCGVRTGVLGACDPNRNFDIRAPAFTGLFLQEWQAGQPIIALHSNSPGFSGDGMGGRGDITMLDAGAFARGEMRVREDGYSGHNGNGPLDDPDVYAIIPYLASAGIGERDTACRRALNSAGVNVWHERVGRSDGSLSNYVALNRPEIFYVNFEVKYESDPTPGAEAQRLMIDAFLKLCPHDRTLPATPPAPAGVR